MKKKFTFLMAALMLLAMMVLPGKVWADDVVITWNISGVAQSANYAQVNTALTTSSITPSGASGTWTAVSSGTSSYAANNSGAQLGASSGREFNGTITLSNTSIPSSATIKSVAVTITANGTSTLSATVNNVSLGSNKSITGTTATYTIEGSQTGNSIVMTFSNTQANKYIKITKIVVTYEEATGPTQLTAPSITPIAGNEKVTLKMGTVTGAVSYTIMWADNPSFTGGIVVTGITSTTWEKTGLTNGQTYYFKAKSIGDGEDYLSSDYGDPVNSVPINLVKITITRSSFGGSSGYGEYELNNIGISGKVYAYATNDDEIQTKSDGATNGNIYNTTAVPGTIKSVKITKSSGSDRTWYLKLDNYSFGKSATTSYINNKSSDYVWNITEGNYCYFNLYISGSGAFYGSSVEISYIPKDYHVTYNSNFGTPATKEFYYDGGETVTAAASDTYTHSSNYTFNSWNTRADGSGTSYSDGATFAMPDEDVVLYAQWDRPLTLNASNELTANTTINAGEVVTISSEAKIPNNITLTVNGKLISENAANLIIEDGGQLICSNSVAATVKKSIANANAKDPKNHWYTISAPVHTGSNNYVTIGASTTVNLTNNGAYDMFAYDEPTHYWLNQKSGSGATGFDKMYAGQGYMYRNSGNELSYVGNTTVGPVNIALSFTSTLDVEGLKGFNLIGNPYTHSITKGTGAAIDNAYLATGFYTLNNSGSWKPQCENGSEIKPNQGILVEATAAVADFQIQDINYSGGGGSKYHNDNIKFTISNNSYEDVTYAWFDKGIGLTKINHRDENAPMLYIPQEGKNYAIATMSDDTKVFGLNFKAATMGQYTLSYKADGNFDYLHIIDRLTGKDIDMLLEGQFTFMANKNDSENRFIVKLGYSPDYSEGNNDIFAYQTGSEILVSGSGELQIFDVTGRKVMTTTINGAESISVPAQGVYIFRLVGNEVKTQKIVVR